MNLVNYKGNQKDNPIDAEIASVGFFSIVIKSILPIKKHNLKILLEVLVHKIIIKI
ncbi:hypothetical protein JMF89_15920 [Clostridiaceae bacterium UIB06]|nr:hypothetical protein [Clostridiaceae bacterium UIB06]